MAESESGDRGQYIVVARRYRPKGFEDLVGQGMVSQALRNAIRTDRVGHAYLFTGARGVGKTSTARIISKALNCEQGPTETPCHECDICMSISSGDDVDVLEIDGASNRGIDEIRQLRSNVSVRPSRSRYKIYIIDEVHMLTKEAFNALLKTLEEPPEHVKFIFCTTDPEKIPITVLSRCQRFDFAPVGADEIVTRLKYIVTTEGSDADEEALKLLARKAAGSVRDSQSLLEQLMSFTSEHITVEAVHQMLGTADTTLLFGIAKTLADNDAAGALGALNAAINQGVDAGQLAEQLLGCLRDLLALSVGGTKELLLHCSEGDADELTAIATSWGTSNLLAAAQILDQSLARMRIVTHSRILLETALIRIAHLEDLQELANLIDAVQSGSSPPPPAAKKKTQLTDAVATDAVATETVAAETVATQPRTDAGETQLRVDESHAQVAAPAPHIETPSPSKVTESPVAESAPPSPPKSTGSPAPTSPANSQAAPSAGETRAQPVVPAKTNGTSDGVSASSTASTGTAGEVATDPATEQVSAPAGVGSAKEIWQAAITQFEGMAEDYASHFTDVANIAPNRLVVTFPSSYTSSKSFCERPRQHGEMEKVVSEIAGKKLKLEFSLRADAAHETPGKPVLSARQLEREVTQRDFVRRAAEIFAAEVTGVYLPRAK